MIINMIGGGGGPALNFKVVPGLTQPVTASENTIWVKTERIGSFYFSATQPEGMQEWDVWFPTDMGSNVEFNALKKNGIQVYPLSAKQYVSGAWVSVEAKSYQNGEWVTLWDGGLYKSGDEYEVITGGWTANGYSVYADGSTRTVYLGTKAETYLQTNYASGYKFYMFGTQNIIGLTGTKHIEINVEKVSGERIVVYASNSKVIRMGNTTPVLEITKTGTFNLDVSGIDSAYIALIPYPDASNPPVWKIHSVRCVI